MSSKQFQQEVQALAWKLFRPLAALTVVAALPFVANRAVPPDWIRIWVVVGMIWTLVMWFLAFGEFGSHRATVVSRLENIRERLISGVKVSRYGLSLNMLMRAFAVFKLLTAPYPLLSMYFLCILEDPGVLSAGFVGSQFLERALAHYGVALTMWIKSALAECDGYSWEVWFVTRDLGNKSNSTSTVGRKSGDIPPWLIRVETMTFSYGIVAPIFAAVRPGDLPLVAAISAAMNLSYFTAYHFFLVWVYRQARRTSPRLTFGRGRSDLDAPGQPASGPTSNPPL